VDARVEATQELIARPVGFEQLTLTVVTLSLDGESIRNAVWLWPTLSRKLTFYKSSAN
jgi:hypothetical protein